MNTRARHFALPDARWLSMIAFAGALTLFAGCGAEPRGDRTPTTGVSGQIMVDGSPVPAEKPLRVICNCTSGTAVMPSQALTGVDGRFEISTYESGDGVPSGDYSLTFFWGKLNPLAGTYDGPDQLNETYIDPADSKVVFSVATDGDAIDLGTIDLTTDTRSP